MRGSVVVGVEGLECAGWLSPKGVRSGPWRRKGRCGAEELGGAEEGEGSARAGGGGCRLRGGRGGACVSYGCGGALGAGLAEPWRLSGWKCRPARASSVLDWPALHFRVLSYSAVL